MKIKKTFCQILTTVFFCLMTICCLSACGGGSDGTTTSNSGNSSGFSGGNNDTSIAVSSVSLNRSSAMLEIGDTFELYETIYPSNATDKSVTWSSSNTLVATVSNGTVVARSAGTATITVRTSNYQTATCTVTVSNPASQTVVVSSVSLNQSSATMEVGDTLSLTATVSPNNATDKSVAWSSSNTSVATVNGGMVIAQSAGTATITVRTSNNKTATCSVTVQAKSPFTFAEYGTGYAVTGYTGTDMTVTVPSTYNGKAVVAIGTDSWTLDGFYNNTFIKNVVLPDSIYTIGKSAFQNCYFLETIEMPNVINISDSAFYNCGALQEIIIPESCILLGYNAFYGCNIKKLTIENKGELTDSYSYIGNKVEELTLGGVDVLSNEFNGYPNLKKLVLLDGVTEIAENCFTNMKELESVVLPNSVKRIGEYAFSGCSSLTSIEIPDRVTSIGRYAFEFCSSLTDVYITDIVAWCNISFEGGEANPLCCAKNLYLNNELVTKLTIPERVKEISDYIFFGYNSLTEVIIHDSVVSIGFCAFYNTNLTKVIIPASVMSIGQYAFFNTNLTKVIIPASVTSIGQYAFYNNSLTEITLSINDESNSLSNIVQVAILRKTTIASATRIGTEVFSGCTSLTEVVISDGVTRIDKCALIYCNSLTSITIPFVGASKNGTSDTHFGYIFGASGFSDNDDYVPSSLKKVTITGGTISAYAFSGCTSLTEVVIGNGVTSIGLGAFWDCDNLTSVVSPDSVTSIGKKAFYDCDKLTSVEIGDSVTSIGEEAFYSCDKLVEVYNKSSLTITKGYSSNGYVGYYAKNVYTPTSGESKLSNDNGYIVYTDGEEKILMGYNGTETDLTLPSYITQIYKRAFFDCDKLTSVEIGDSVTSIGKKAFYDCGSLTSLVFRDTSTWYKTYDYTNWENKTGGTQTSVTDSSTNATYFKSRDYEYWYKL